MNIKKLGPVALLWVTSILVPAVALAGGTITGVVIDGFTGQPVRGATLTVGDTDISIPTGVGGDFRGEAPAGTYTAFVKHFSSQSGGPSSYTLEVRVGGSVVHTETGSLADGAESTPYTFTTN